MADKVLFVLFEAAGRYSIESKDRLSNCLEKYCGGIVGGRRRKMRGVLDDIILVKNVRLYRSWRKRKYVRNVHIMICVLSNGGD